MCLTSNLETKDFLEQLNAKNVFFNGNITFVHRIKIFLTLILMMLSYPIEYLRFRKYRLLAFLDDLNKVELIDEIS